MKTILTDRFLASLRPAEPGKRPIIWDTSNPAFGVRVTDRGVRSFVVVRRMPGKKQPVKITLKPPYPFLKLADARKKAGEVLGDLAAGIHPKQREREACERKAEAQRAEAARSANSFRAVAEDFIVRHAARKRTGTAISQLVRRELVSRWGERPITEINKGDVIALVEDIEAKSPSAARQAWIYTQRLFGWALNRDAYGLTSSPCDRVSITDLIGSAKARERILSDSELRSLWAATEGEDYPLHPFIRLLIVLGCRRGELAGMTRNEVDLDAGLWRLGGDRTKIGEPRIVPLPAMAVEIIRSLPEWTGPFVFSTTSDQRPISGFAKLKARLDRLHDVRNWRLHDLRRTMRTHLSALQISPLVAELAIGHRQRGVLRVYDQHRYESELRDALEKWCARLRGIVDPTSQNVVPLREAAR